ncbi:MAG: hypothetical protein QM743_08690 [Chitinophagaceae bacterium]
MQGFNKVWIDRVAPFNDEEMPAVNVSLGSGDYDNESPRSSDGTYVFFIDVYSNAKETDNKDAEERACSRLDRIVGAIRAILKHPDYRTLDFPAPSLSRVTITGFQKGLANPQDATSAKAARIQFTVRVQETVQLAEGVPLGSNYTTVKLAGTDKGYLWIYEAPETFYIVSEEGDLLISENSNYLIRE